MNTGTNFFTVALPCQSRTLPHQDELCSPWTEELHDYRKHPLYRPRPERPLPSRRYTSQLDHHTAKASTKEKNKNEQTSLLAEKAVTIEYEGDRPSPAPAPTPRPNPHKLKLPSLSSFRCSRSSALRPSPCTTPSQRSSLRRQTPRHQEHPAPHFQIYKRSLVAARQWLSCGYSAN